MGSFVTGSRKTKPREMEEIIQHPSPPPATRSQGVGDAWQELMEPCRLWTEAQDTKHDPEVGERATVLATSGVSSCALKTELIASVEDNMGLYLGSPG